MPINEIKNTPCANTNSSPCELSYKPYSIGALLKDTRCRTPRSGIYKITNPSGHIYIGQSRNLNRRKYDYSNPSRHERQRRIINSIKKHGWENHTFEIIQECPNEELNIWEKYYISLYDTFNTPHGMNLTSGGYSRTTLSDEARKKMSDSQKKYLLTHPERAKSIKNALLKSHRTGKEHVNYGLGKKVSQFTLTGRFIKEHSSVSRACESINVSYTNRVYAACSRKSGVYTAHGFIWRYLSDCCVIDGVLQENILLTTPKELQKRSSAVKKRFDNIAYRLQNKEHLERVHKKYSGKNNTNYGTGRSVAQFKVNGEYVKTFVSSWDAAKSFALGSPQRITRCCKRLPRYKSHKGFLWRFLDESCIINNFLQEGSKKDT